MVETYVVKEARVVFIDDDVALVGCCWLLLRHLGVDVELLIVFRIRGLRIILYRS